MMGKISFFLGLQISQSPRGIFINQSKYAFKSLKKYDFKSCDPVDTPMVEKSKLDEDKERKAVDPSHYHGMIRNLLYLTAIRTDLQFAICMYARYQDSCVALTAFADAHHTGCQDTRHNTSEVQKLLKHAKQWLAIISDSNPVIILNASIPSKRKHDLSMGINFLGHGLLYDQTMDMTIDQQVALDEALVPYAYRLRIGRCNFRLLSDISSKESTLQLVYDVLR
nr:hypothetical protein [Tanacetum cinerariifolium]